MPVNVAQTLIPFGFTNFESEIYAFLLTESPATGYRVAQALGKAAANTYKALDSLQQKGAVLAEEGSTRLFRAVPSDELLARLTRDFEWRRAEAELMLSRLSSESEDSRVYALRSRGQVIERARHMLGACESVALLTCSSEVAGLLTDAIRACTRKGARVFVAGPNDMPIEGVNVVESTSPLDELRICCDGAELLTALFSPVRGDVIQAIWTKSAYLALCAYRGMSAELRDLGLEPPEFEATVGLRRVAAGQRSG